MSKETLAGTLYPSDLTDAPWTILEPLMPEPHPAWRIEVKTRPEGAKAFIPLEKRWVVERTHAWHGRYRCKSKDSERTPQSSATLIYMSNIHVMLRKLTSHCRPEFHDRSVTAASLKLVA